MLCIPAKSSKRRHW